MTRGGWRSPIFIVYFAIYLNYTGMSMPRQEAWRRYVNCRLEAGGTVDVYLGRLEQLGSRLGLTLND